jgi:hypothetical protein
MDSKRPIGQNRSVNKDQIARESLFNEVKGSLFEFLVARNLARVHQQEKSFLDGIDRNYLNVLIQQDRMVRQFYPELGRFLEAVAQSTSLEMSSYLKATPHHPLLIGKLVNSVKKQEWHEADLIVEHEGKPLPVSLKLNKRGSYVNTKSAGIKSFFTQYFSYVNPSFQAKFNQQVELEFERMARDLHAKASLKWKGDFSDWVQEGHSELPGEVGEENRKILKSYYARLANSMHQILTQAQVIDPLKFEQSLNALLGFSSPDILQVTAFHDFKNNSECEITLHELSELSPYRGKFEITPFGDIASVEIKAGNWSLQIRIKPMNKFTTTAIKINCSVKIKRPNDG